MEGYQANVTGGVRAACRDTKAGGRWRCDRYADRGANSSTHRDTRYLVHMVGGGLARERLLAEAKREPTCSGHSAMTTHTKSPSPTPTPRFRRRIPQDSVVEDRRICSATPYSPRGYRETDTSNVIIHPFLVFSRSAVLTMDMQSRIISAVSGVQRVPKAISSAPHLQFFCRKTYLPQITRSMSR